MIGNPIFPSVSKLSRKERERQLGQHALTVWLTGLPGSGKTTLAVALERRLFDFGHACHHLDGDNLRAGLSRDLGFSEADRAENVRRAAHIARLQNESGLISIVSLISPMAAARAMAREIVGRDHFLEVHVHAPVQVCEARDPKGLYARARAGELAAFTGISAPYESPANPHLRIETAEATPEASAEQLALFVKSYVSV